MRDLFVAPLVSADNGYAQHFHLRRLNQGQKRLHITAARPRTILIDDDFLTLLRGRGEQEVAGISENDFVTVDIGKAQQFGLSASRWDEDEGKSQAEN